MKFFSSLSVAWVGLVCACSSRVIDSAHHAARPDGGAAVDSGVAHLATEAGTLGAPEAALPYAACPNVFAGPVADPQRNDRGTEGLTVLRERVQASHKVFEAYAAAHGNTYHYTRQFDSFTSEFCETTVEVTSGVVISVTERSGGGGNGITTETRTGKDLKLNLGCHPAVTMDALYEQCLTEVLCQDPRANSLYVEIDARGLLVECGYFPMNCADDCYEGLEPLILTADGTDWTKSFPGCCEPSPAPDCCMKYGGTASGITCGLTCDGMPPPDHPGWDITIDSQGCMSWTEPREGTFQGCCGCVMPVDGGTQIDAGTKRRDAGG